MERFGPALELLGQRKETDSVMLFWAVGVLVALPLLLILGHFILKWIQRSRRRSIGFQILDKAAGQKGLTYKEQNTLEQMAKYTKLGNPGVLASSIDAFDRAVANWMASVNQMPWMDMEARVESLKAVRTKLGFRFLSAERIPQTTRELVLGQTLYALAPGEKGLRLLFTNVFELDDLAIWTDGFRTDEHSVAIEKLRPIWAFFWSESGGEYRFKTKVIKEVMRPEGYLMLAHGDSLESDPGRKIFSCDLEAEMGAEWVKSRDGRTVPSQTLFDDPEKVQKVDVTLCELSGSGFSLALEEEVGINDLLRLGGHPDLPTLLQGIAGRAVDQSPFGARFKFQNLSTEDQESVIRYVAPRISPEVFRTSNSRNSLLVDAQS